MRVSTYRILSAGTVEYMHWVWDTVEYILKILLVMFLIPSELQYRRPLQSMAASQMSRMRIAYHIGLLEIVFVGFNVLVFLENSDFLPQKHKTQFLKQFANLQMSKHSFYV